LIDQILADDLQSLGPRRPRKELVPHVVPKDDQARPKEPVAKHVVRGDGETKRPA
jgi:hypothetical protein